MEKLVHVKNFFSPRRQWFTKSFQTFVTDVSRSFFSLSLSSPLVYAKISIDPDKTEKPIQKIFPNRGKGEGINVGSRGLIIMKIDRDRQIVRIPLTRLTEITK